MNLARRGLSSIDCLAALIERTGPLPLVVLSAVYWAFTLILAFRKLMWNDELYTYYIARLPTMGDVWGALLAGGEQTPPFFYVITRLAFRLFGTSAVAMRVPEMLGFWVMSVCLFVVLGRRMPKLAALCAAAFPLVTSSYAYAFEARPYGLVLGFGAVALLSWQTVTLGRRRAVSLLLLAASLAATVSTHYYGLFVILPLAAGEATRSLSRSRIDLAVWAAFVAAVLPLAWHLPLLRAGAAYAGTFWSPPEWLNLPDYYKDLLAPAAVPIVVVLILAGLCALVPGAESSVEASREPLVPPLPEVVAAVGFVVIPMICFTLAKLVTGAFVNRYAVASVIGFGLVAGYGVAMSFRRQPAMRLITAVCLGGWFIVGQARELRHPTYDLLPVRAEAMTRPSEWLRSVADQSLPLVVAEAHTFTALSHYAPADVTSRLVYLADPELALQRLGHNSVERGMLDLLGPWFGMNVKPFRPFMAEHSRFLVYGSFVGVGFLNWLLPELQARGMHIELLNQAGDTLLLLASRDSGPAVAVVPHQAPTPVVPPRTHRSTMRR